MSTKVVSLSDIWQALLRRKKLFLLTSLLFVLVGIAAFIRGQSSRVLKIYLQPASYLSKGKMMFVQDSGQLTSAINYIYVPQLVSGTQTKAVPANFMQLKASLPTVGGQSVDKSTNFNSIELSMAIHSSQLKAIKPAFTKLLQKVQAGQQSYLTSQQQDFAAQLAVAKSQILSDRQLLAKLNTQVPVMKQLLQREYPGSSDGSALTKRRTASVNSISASLFGMVKSANAAEILAMVSKSNERINTLTQNIAKAQQEILLLQQEQKSLQKAQYVSGYILSPARFSPALKLVVLIIIGLVIAFFLALLVDAIRRD